MNFISKWRKGKKPPVQLDDCDYDSDRKRNRRNLMALLGGAVGFGVAEKASAQQASTLSNMPYASTPLSGAELTYVVQSGVSKKTPVSSISGSGGGTPGGANGQLQYNNSGSFGGYGVGTGLAVVGGNLTATAAASGMQVVTSVAALQAIIGIAGQAVYLDSGGRSGIFAWQVGDHSVDGTNDPGQGEWVVPVIYSATFVVSGTISPNLVGTYTLAGSFNGRPYYTSPVIPGVIWYYTLGPDCIIGSHLGASEPAFAQSSSATTPPTGSYPNNGVGGATGTATLAVGTPAAGAGAWQRQWNGTCDWAWWGAIADTVCLVDPVTWISTDPGTGANTDNGGAFLSWQTWAQYKSSLGLGVYVEPSYGVTGVYGWMVGTTGFYWVQGIKKLHINGRKIISMQQLEANQGSETQFPVINSVDWNITNAALIQSTVIGNTAFTLVSASNSSKFTIDAWCVLTSIDTQRGGYPPNPQNYQYVQVMASIVYPSIAISSGTYNSTSGALALTFATPPLGTPSTTSSSTVLIGLGSKTFVVPTGLNIQPGASVNAAASGGTMAGTIISYDGVTTGNLVFDVPGYQNFSGSGTFSTWTMTFTQPNLVGQWITISGLTGTGAFASLDGSWKITSITGASLVVNATATAGLGAATITGGTLAATGIVVVGEPIENAHLSTNPDYSTTPTAACGAARATVMPNWDYEHIYEKIQVNTAFSPNSPNGNYLTFGAAKSITTIDWVGVGVSETMCSSVVHIRPRFKTPGETDKMVETITWTDPDCPTVVIGLQSPCPKNMNISGGRLYGIAGCSQNLTVRGTELLQYALMAFPFGCNYSVSFDACRIYNATDDAAGIFDAGSQINIDGSIISYASGTFTINLGTITFNIGTWSLVPGMVIMLEGTASDTGLIQMTADYGALLVMGVRQDSPTSPSFLYIDTNGPTALPGWSNNKAYIIRVGTVEYKNCTGNGAIRSYSDAAARGKNLLEWYRQIIVGTTIYPYATNVNVGLFGVLTSVQVNVSVPHPTGSSTIVLTIRTALVTQGPSGTITTDSGYTVITIDITTLGHRVITPTAFINKASADSITVGGVSSPTLPPNRLVYAMAYTVTAPSTTSPMIELIVETDTGIVKKPRNTISNFAGDLQ